MNRWRIRSVLLLLCLSRLFLCYYVFPVCSYVIMSFPPVLLLLCLSRLFLCYYVFPPVIVSLTKKFGIFLGSMKKNSYFCTRRMYVCAENELILTLLLTYIQ